jgi:predicted Zn-dependent peptidase
MVMSNVKKDTLPNGLMVITEAMPAVRSVSIGVWLRVGSRQESEAENGLTHFIEHMVFKGTGKRSAEEIAKAADAIGGHLDAFTSKEYTSFSIKVLDEHLTRAFDILADLVRRPLFRAQDISKEGRVVQEEIRMVEDIPDDLVHEMFTQRYWRGHALGRPILGVRRTVRSFDRRRVLGFYRRHYTPANLLVTAAGHLDHRRILDLADQAFGDLPAGSAAPPQAPPLPHPHLCYRRKKELEQAHLCVGTEACAYADPKRYAMHILNAVLGGGMSSRLFQNIREKRGLAYSVFSAINCHRDAGCLTVYAGIAAANLRQTLELILQEFSRLKSEPIPTEEFQRAKDYLKGATLLALESTGSRMSSLARHELYYRRHISLDEIEAAVDAVTQDQVLAIARQAFRPEALAATVLSPRPDFRLTRRDLAC